MEDPSKDLPEAKGYPEEPFSQRAGRRDICGGVALAEIWTVASRFV